MTRSVYIIGGAGTGKSTFTGELLRRVGEPLGPLEDLYTKPNSRGTQITLRGHRVGREGLYLGCMRDSFPGTDGLDRVSYIPGEEWLEGSLPDFIIGEGATLAVRRFIRALHMNTELLLVHLTCEDWVKELRLAERGSEQADSFVLGTATRAANLARDMQAEGVQVVTAETSEMYDWGIALDMASSHLFGVASPPPMN